MVDFVTGTKTVFQQTSAPTGWTKDTTYHDYTLRVVNGTAGTGGSVNFTSCMVSQPFSGTVSSPYSGVSGATTLSTAQMGPHTHTYKLMPPRPSYIGMASPAPSLAAAIPPASPAQTPITFNYTGGGGSHAHPISTLFGFTGTNINFSVNYVDLIVSTKN